MTYLVRKLYLRHHSKCLRDKYIALLHGRDIKKERKKSSVKCADWRTTELVRQSTAFWQCDVLLLYDLTAFLETSVGRKVNISVGSFWGPFCFVVWRVNCRKLQLDTGTVFGVLYGQ